MKGALTEMRVATYYMSIGHYVYWPAVKNGPADMVVEKEDLLLRVQAKTATWIRSGTFSYLQCRIRSSNDKVTAQSGHYDLVVVSHDDELWEIPASLIFSTNICLRGNRPGRKAEAWDNFKVR